MWAEGEKQKPNQPNETKQDSHKPDDEKRNRPFTGCFLLRTLRIFPLFCFLLLQLQWHSPCSISLAGLSRSSRSRMFSATFGWVFVQHVGEFGPDPELVIQVQNTGIWKFTPAALTEPGKCRWNNIPEKSQLLCAAQRLFCSAACWFPIHSSLSPSPLLHFSVKSKKLA